METTRRPWMSYLLVLLVVDGIWSCGAYNNQHAKWLEKHLTRPGAVHVAPRPGIERRHLVEGTETGTLANGWRSSLVDEDHRLHSRNNVSSVERIRNAAERSRSRARYLDARVRSTPYGKTKTPGRKSLLQTTSSFESPVAATPGSYSMTFSIGTPVQNFVAIADTGSDLVWIQCAACTVCFDQPGPFFDPSASSTYAPLGCSTACDNLGGNALQCSPNCQYSYSYGDQSTTAGDFSTDTVTLTGADVTTTTAVPDFQFGCGLQNQGTFSDVDGLVGLGRGPVSFPSQIASYLDNVQKFSYCLVSKYEDTNVTSPIIFGAAAVPTAPGLVYTPLLSPYPTSSVPFYYTNLLDISVGGTALGIPASAFAIDDNGNGGTLFDSGTTYTSLTTAAYTPVVDALRSGLTEYNEVDLSKEVGLDLCYDVTGSSRVQVPKVVFHFDKADFDLPFDNIVVSFSSNSGEATYICLAMMESDGMNIFGNTQQQNFQVVYEEDTLQIGWVPLDCKTL